MAVNDADMPTSELSDDAQEIAKHIQSIRQDLESLAGAVARIGGRQLDRAKSTASDAASELEGTIRRNPLSAIAIAVGIGFLYGVLTRR
jgi:ElaB/YqjD/DUF883 family membrane-anchored ribosome-binding protein